MHHIIQAARRTGKSAVGYKVQLVIHRMTAQLPATFHNAELCAVITRHKKRIVTKSSSYQADKKEIVWGDILPLSCTLYLAKSGLFQAKMFQVQIFDTKNDHQIAMFEFNLAELVQSNRDSSKESLMVPAVKCLDPRASLSITVITTKASAVVHQSTGPDQEEISFDGSQSDMSNITLESRPSITSSNRHGRPHTDDRKSEVIRGVAIPVSDNDAMELYTLKIKQHEYVRTIQNLEEQLRHSEAENVKLQKLVDEKDLIIDKLREDKDELEQQTQVLQQNTRSTTDESDEEMKVDFIKYMTLQEDRDRLDTELRALKLENSTDSVKLQEENEQLKEELESLKNIMADMSENALLAIGRPPDEQENSSVQEDDEEQEKHSEYSSDNEIAEPNAALVAEMEAEISQLKAQLSAQHENGAVEANTTTIAEMEAEIIVLKATVAQLNAQQHNKVEEPNAAMMAEMEAEIIALKATVAELNAQNESSNSTLMSQNGILLTQRQALESTLAQLNSRCDEEHLASKALLAQNQSLMSQLQEMEFKLDTLECEKRRYEEQNEMEEEENKVENDKEMERENERLVQQLNQLDHVVTKLQNEKEQLEEQLQHTREQEEDAEQRVRALSNEGRLENERLVQRLNEIDQLVMELKAEKDELVEKWQQAELGHSRAQKEMEDAQLVINDLHEQKEGLASQLQQAQDANERAQMEISSAQATIEQLRSQVEEISNRLQIAQQELEMLTSDELSTSSAAAAAAITKNQELQGRWDEMKLQNDQLQIRVEELELQLNQTDSDGQEKEAELQRQVDQLREETAQLREELDYLHASKQQAEAELHDRTMELKEALETQQRRMTEHEVEVGELTCKNQDTKSEMEKVLADKEIVSQELQKKVTDLEQENNYFQGELIDCKMKVAELMVQNEELSAQYKRMERNLNEYKNKIDPKKK